MSEPHPGTLEPRAVPVKIMENGDYNLVSLGCGPGHPGQGCAMDLTLIESMTYVYGQLTESPVFAGTTVPLAPTISDGILPGSNYAAFIHPRVFQCRAGTVRRIAMARYLDHLSKSAAL